MAPLRAIRQRPTLWVELGVAAAWIALLVGTGVSQGAGGTGEPSGVSGPLWVCVTGMTGMGGGAGSHATAGPFAPDAFGVGVPMWALMAVAMMVPTAMPAVRHVGSKSLYWRRRRATAEFLAVYVGLWALFGAVALGFLAAWGPARSRYALAAALLLAALWQLTPLKQRAQRACHRSRPLPPRGWRAGAGVADFALRYGTACLASCWAMMLAATVSGPGRLLWMGALAGGMAAEKLTLKPKRASWRVAALLGAAAVGVAAAVALG